MGVPDENFMETAGVVMKKHSRKIFVDICLCLVLSLGITLLAVAAQPNAFRDMLGRFLHQPLLLLLNVLPIFLVTVSLGALLGNIFFGATLGNVVVCCLSIANRVKVTARDEALLPRDILLLREAGEAMESYDIQLPVKVIFAVVLVSLLLLTAGVWWRKGHHTHSGWVVRGGGMLIPCAMLAVLTMTVYASEDIYYSFDCTNSYYEARTYNEYGMPYSFVHYITANLVERPEGYDPQTAREWEQAGVQADAPQVHLIMIMSEAFTDLPCEAGIGEDPLPFFHSLQQNPHAISGRVVVPDFGGGTANTEFDVLTGIQTDSLGTATTTAFTAVQQNLGSLFRVFRGEEYVKSFIHPGYRWFYNRENTYQRLGAESCLFYEDMSQKEMKGTWVTDNYVADQVIAEFEDTVAQGKLLFNYTTTIQNHMTYTMDKYGQDYTIPLVETSVPLSQESQELLSVYTEGLRDGDRALEKLVTYFQSQGEPVVLALWGDHYPNLGGNLSVYEELGLLEEETYPFQYYATPYVVWANDAAAELLGWNDRVQQLELPQEGYLSASFFGSMVLELCGREDSFTAFLNELRRVLPVVWKDQCYLDSEGNLLETLTKEQQSMISKWRCWSYYRLTDKEYGDGCEKTNPLLG